MVLVLVVALVLSCSTYMWSHFPRAPFVVERSHVPRDRWRRSLLPTKKGASVPTHFTNKVVALEHFLDGKIIASSPMRMNTLGREREELVDNETRWDVAGQGNKAHRRHQEHQLRGQGDSMET